MKFPGPKNSILSLVVLAVVLGVFEISSFAFFKIRKERFSFSNPSEFVLNDEDIERVARTFDPILGWKTKHSTPYGERPREKEYDGDFLAAFGDSYTYCDEVRDHETWQTYLSAQLQQNIFNFGNGAYGTDQALLRFRQEQGKVKTRFMVLGLTSENINRIVNLYRKFYSPSTGMPATKPRFVLQGERLSLMANPVGSVEGLQRLKDERFIEELGRDDFWYNQANRPHFSFPYAKILFNRNIWSEITQGKSGDRVDRTSPMIRKSPWQEEESRRLMFALFDAFVKEAGEAGAIPVILVLPLEFELSHRIRTQTYPQALVEIIKYCQSKGYKVFCPIDELVGEVMMRNNVNLFAPGGHYSANGNRTLATYLYRFFLMLDRREGRSPAP